MMAYLLMASPKTEISAFWTDQKSWSKSRSPLVFLSTLLLSGPFFLKALLSYKFFLSVTTNHEPNYKPSSLVGAWSTMVDAGYNLNFMLNTQSFVNAC